MRIQCENRFCGKEIDTEDCYSYSSLVGKVFFCNERCYKEHIGAIKLNTIKEKMKSNKRIKDFLNTDMGFAMTGLLLVSALPLIFTKILKLIQTFK